MSADALGVLLPLIGGALVTLGGLCWMLLQETVAQHQRYRELTDHIVLGRHGPILASPSAEPGIGVSASNGGAGDGTAATARRLVPVRHERVGPTHPAPRPRPNPALDNRIKR